MIATTYFDKGRRHTTLLIATVFLLLVFTILAAVYFGYFRSQQGKQNAYDRLIWEAAARHHVSPFLVKAVIARESSFRASAKGKMGEMGLMQITDGAVKDWARHTGHRPPLPGLLFDPRLNVEIGTWYLGRGLLRWHDYRSRNVLALAHYNAGAGNARKWAPEIPSQKVELNTISFPSTREYIRVVLENWNSFEREHRAREPNQ